MEKSSSSSRVIELTVISAQDLYLNRRQRLKKNAFVVVKIDPFNYKSTGIDADGGSHPTWNEKMVMDLPMHANFMDVEVQCKTDFSGNKMVGTARIPVSDFYGGYLPLNYLSLLSYRLRDQNGDKNGIINLSVKVIKGGAEKEKNKGWAASCSRPWNGPTGFPAKDNVVTGIVTGIPVYRN